MAKFTAFLVISNGRILQSFETAEEAEAGVEKVTSSLETSGSIYIAEVISVYTRKVSYDKVSV